VVAEQDWLTVGEAARQLGVNEQTVRRYADEGRLVTVRLPSRHRRVSAASVEVLRREIYGEDAGESAGDE
jgi:excisionase family DNA binding protein